MTAAKMSPPLYKASISTVQLIIQTEPGLLPAKQNANEEDANGDSTETPSAGRDASTADAITELGMGSNKKKSRTKKAKSKRGLAAPTGFEEFYVDAPLTPVEFEEEQGLYDPRIEYAIQRYCVRRNMDSPRKDVFDKYLSFGGISAGPKQFAGGLDAKDMSDMDAAEIALMKATHFVDADKWGSEGAYEVDFETCAKAFFSSRVPWVYDLSGPDSSKLVKAKTNVIRNFLNYLLHHDVCPEYKSQIFAARAVCDLADRELPMIAIAQSCLPGDFQTACSEIFGGSFRGIHGGNPDWATDVECLVGMSLDLARQTFRVGMSTHVSDEVAKMYIQQNEAGSIAATKVYNTGLEIIELIRASDEVKAFYEHHSAAEGLKPLGRLIAKTWTPPYKLPKDLTEEEKAAEANATQLTETHSFLVEDYVLETCFVGMKLEVTVREMSFGLKFFDTVSGVFCSFYTLLPNELMIGWRIPEAEPLPYRKSYNAVAASAEELDGEAETMKDNADRKRFGNDDAEDTKDMETQKDSKDVPRVETTEA
ncbi:MAG: hypothetical protein LQ338_000418 [Usnochroma carphineum]|nr:MAG: hypothetical protein LQ338_000418 [Usnochroma carphineum]